MTGHSILLVDRDDEWRGSLKAGMLHEHIRVLESSAPSELATEFRRVQPDGVVVGVCPEDEGIVLEQVRRIRGEHRRVPFILITSAGSEALAVAALRAGVKDYFRRPIAVDAVTAGVQRCLKALDRPRLERERLRTTYDATESRELDTGAMLGDSPAMVAIKDYIARVAVNDTSVLITGETGTGKELAAELIHRNSRRRHKPFVSINCAAIPDGLLENELFGHEAGAFTGARSAKEGQLQLAEGGTVLFDEIGDMGSYAQAKILRIIEGKPFYRLGGRRSIPVDIRVIAATNQDLDRAMSEGRFRKDLYYRLNVARIHLPPIRERREDIPRLVAGCVRELNRRFHRDVKGCTTEALAGMLRYDWPGNVRELRNMLESTFASLPSGPVSSLDLPEEFRRRLAVVGQAPPGERAQLMSALLSTNWNKSKAAERLHWSRMTLYRKMAKYHVTQSPTPDAEDCHSEPAPVTPRDTRP